MARRRRQAAQRSIGQVQILHAAAKAKLSAALDDPLADRLDHRRQPIAPQVRAMIVNDRRLSLALGEHLEHAADVRAARAAGELAVAERAGSAFAKQVIALRVVRPAGVEGVHVANPLAHRLAALEHQRPITLLGQKVGGEHARRPGTHDDGPLAERLVAWRGHFKRWFAIQLHRDVLRPPTCHADQLRLVRPLAGRHLQRINVLHVRFVPGIQALAQDAPPRDLARADPQGRGCAVGQR